MAMMKGSFRAGVPLGVTSTMKVGDVVDPAAMEEIRREHEARIKLNISDPSGVRPFIDQPMVDGTLSLEPKERSAQISQLVHEYRTANPRVVHAAGFPSPEFDNTDDVLYLTNLYYQFQAAFVAMLGQIRDQEILPKSPKLDTLVWENVAFPRLANNLHLLRAGIIYFEQDDTGLVVHILFVYSRGQATVFSTRYPL